MDKGRFCEIISESGKEVYSFCLHLTGSRELADDLYQDTFLKAWELSHKISLEGNPKSYILGIAIKLWQNQKRKQAVRHKIIPMEEYREEKGREKMAVYENLPNRRRSERAAGTGQAGCRRTAGENPYGDVFVLYGGVIRTGDCQNFKHCDGNGKKPLNKGRNQVRKRMEVYMDEQAVNG